MAITVKLNEETTKNEVKPFPKLMKLKDGNGIVFFRYYGNGVVIVKDSKWFVHDVGKYCSSWDMVCFTDYNEPLTIQNA